MKLLLFTFLLMTCFANLQAQDEKFFKEKFKGEMPYLLKLEGAGDAFDFHQKKYKWMTYSPFYEVDLNGDGVSESFLVEKRDSEDWLSIYNALRKRIESFRLETIGQGSKIYRIALRKLSPVTKLVMIYFYEGWNEGFKFAGSGRLYFLTIDNNDLATMALYKGPNFWEERKEYNGSYSKRKYKISLYDLDNDGIKDIVLKHHKISRVFFYKGKGRWKVF